MNEPSHNISGCEMTRLKLSVPTAMYALWAYVFFLPFSLLLAAGIWANSVSGVLYLCTDSMGAFGFIPPFVHPGTDDLYYVPAWRVYLLWYASLASAVLVPAVIVWLVCCMSRKDDELDA